MPVLVVIVCEDGVQLQNTFKVVNASSGSDPSNNSTKLSQLKFMTLLTVVTSKPRKETEGFISNNTLYFAVFRKYAFDSTKACLAKNMELNSGTNLASISKVEKDSKFPIRYPPKEFWKMFFTSFSNNFMSKMGQVLDLLGDPGLMIYCLGNEIEYQSIIQSDESRPLFKAASIGILVNTTPHATLKKILKQIQKNELNEEDEDENERESEDENENESENENNESKEKNEKKEKMEKKSKKWKERKKGKKRKERKKGKKRNERKKGKKREFKKTTSFISRN